MIFIIKKRIAVLALAGTLCMSGAVFGSSAESAIHYDIYDSNNNLVLSNSTDADVLSQTFPAKIQAAMEEVQTKGYAFHHIGVYEATSHHGWETEHKSSNVTVHVKDKSAPVVLSLTAYEPVNWKITCDSGVEIAKVIASGYYNQTIEGVDENCVIIGTWEGGNDDYIQVYGTNWQAEEKLKGFYGILPYSIQGAYTGSSFTVVTSDQPKESTAKESKTTDDSAVLRDVKSTGKIKMIGSTKNQGLTCTYGGAGASTVSVSDSGHTAGKYYFEMKLNLDGNSEPDTWTWAGIIGEKDGSSIAYQLIDTWGDGLFYPEELKDGDILGIAIDLNKGIGYTSLNNVWKTGEPGSGTGFYLHPDLTYYAAASCSASSSLRDGKQDSWTAAFKEKAFKYDLPNDYSAFEY